ncbi:hypothetical protein C8R44DRAFT_974597, partial [Mycena epipterygia]
MPNVACRRRLAPPPPPPYPCSRPRAYGSEAYVHESARTRLGRQHGAGRPAEAGHGAERPAPPRTSSPRCKTSHTCADAPMRAHTSPTQGVCTQVRLHPSASTLHLQAHRGHKRRAQALYDSPRPRAGLHERAPTNASACKMLSTRRAENTSQSRTSATPRPGLHERAPANGSTHARRSERLARGRAQGAQTDKRHPPATSYASPPTPPRRERTHWAHTCPYTPRTRHCPRCTHTTPERAPRRSVHHVGTCTRRRQRTRTRTSLRNARSADHPSRRSSKAAWLATDTLADAAVRGMSLSLSAQRESRRQRRAEGVQTTRAGLRRHQTQTLTLSRSRITTPGARGRPRGRKTVRERADDPGAQRRRWTPPTRRTNERASPATRRSTRMGVRARVRGVYSMCIRARVP